MARNRHGTRPLVTILEDSTLRHLPGTAGAYLPFWSPDNKAIAFFAEGKLKRLDLPEGAPVILADAPNARGALGARWA